MFKNIIISLFCLLLLSACGKDAGSPEEQIRNMISAMESAAEQRSLDSVKELISDDYQDDLHIDRRTALRSLMFYFQRNQSIHLLARISDIKIDEGGNTARVIVFVGMAGEPVEKSEALIDLNADLYRFDIDLVADGDEWLLRSARWQRARAENFEF